MLVAGTPRGSLCSPEVASAYIPSPRLSRHRAGGPSGISRPDLCPPSLNLGSCRVASVRRFRGRDARSQKGQTLASPSFPWKASLGTLGGGQAAARPTAPAAVLADGQCQRPGGRAASLRVSPAAGVESPAFGPPRRALSLLSPDKSQIWEGSTRLLLRR